MRTSETHDQDEQHGQVHQQSDHAYERFSDPEGHAKVKSQNPVLQTDPEQEPLRDQLRQRGQPKGVAMISVVGDSQEPALIHKTVEAVLTENEVIRQRDAEQFSSLPNPRGEPAILRTRRLRCPSRRQTTARLDLRNGTCCPNTWSHLFHTIWLRFNSDSEHY